MKRSVAACLLLAFTATSADAQVNPRTAPRTPAEKGTTTGDRQTMTAAPGKDTQPDGKPGTSYATGSYFCGGYIVDIGTGSDKGTCGPSKTGGSPSCSDGKNTATFKCDGIPVCQTSGSGTCLVRTQN